MARLWVSDNGSFNRSADRRIDVLGSGFEPSDSLHFVLVGPDGSEEELVGQFKLQELTGAFWWTTTVWHLGEGVYVLTARSE